MPNNWAIRVRDKINAYAADPASQANNVTKLRGTEDVLRLRIGEWRVTMVDGLVLEILTVKPRRGAYEE